MTTTTAPTGITLDLRRAQSRTLGVYAAAGKAVALAKLADLRGRGLNMDRDVETHPAQTFLARFWVIGRPDHYQGVTYLMTDAGCWIPGRLTDAPMCCCETPTRGCRDGHTGAPWRSLSAEVFPAPFTHVTRTVPHAGTRRERYVTKSNGSCGRFVWSDDSVALCTCGWTRHTSTRSDAQTAARAHRAHPEQYPHHATQL